MGHVIRCLALADELNVTFNYNIHFAMRRSALGINKVKETYAVLESSEMDNNFNYASWLEDCIKKTAADVLVLDVRDGFKRQGLKQLKQKTGIKVITIDDPEDKRLESDLAFYPPVPQLEKVNWDDFEGELHVGWEYVILRKEFSRPQLKPNNPIPIILVAMGATDPKRLTFIVLKALKNVSGKIKIEVLVGNQYPFMDKLEKTVKQFSKRIVIHQSPSNVAEIMARADLAIVSFGVTAYELAAVNTPALYLCLTPDHALSAKALDAAGMGFSLGMYLGINDSKIRNTVEDMFINLSGFSNFNNRIYGRGVSRIAKLIQGVFANG